MKIRSGSYANIASTLALVVALGGTSYAAVAITGKDIKNGTITSADVKNKTLKVTDFAASTRSKLTGVAGATGPAGPAGAQGPAGPTGATGARGPSNGFGTYADGPIAWTSPTTDKVIASLALPAGSFVVTGKVDIDSDYGPGNVLTRCDLVSSAGDFDQSRALLNTNGNAGDRETLPFALATTLGSAGTVQLTCDSFGAAMVARFAKITAVEVASLTNTGS